METLISLCMIVKDEEQCLTRCLDSVKDIVDEIIIVDTGSTDKTVKIAESYTEHVYHFKWVNDFAAARNASIERASSTWILVLDADEYLEPEDGLKFRAFLQSLPPTSHTIYSLPIISLLGATHNASVNEIPVDRAFPNHMGIHYHRPIHEQLVSSERIALKSVATPYRILHSGYTEETLTAKNKHERNLSIFRQLKDKQGQYNAYDHLMIGNQYLMMKEYDHASSHLEKALERKHELGRGSSHILFSLLQLYLNTQRYVDALIFMDKYMPDYESYPDIQAIRGVLYYHLGFYREAKETFLHSLYMGEEAAHAGKPHYIIMPLSGVKLSLHYLSSLFEKEKDFGQAISYLTKLYHSFPEATFLSRLIQLLALYDDAASISSFLSKLLNLKDPVIIPLLCKISILQGHLELSQHYQQLLPNSSILTLAEKLRFSLLVQDQVSFQQYWESGTEDEQQDSQVIYHLVLAAVSWNQPSWLKWLSPPQDMDSLSFVKWAEQLLADGMKEESETDRNQAFSLLSGLYTIHHLDRFDKILESVCSDFVLNRVANLLYTLHQDEAAMQCYNYLSENDQLDYHSCLNLSDIFLKLKDVDTASHFLEQAIRLNPQERTLYVRFCSICPDPSRLDKMKQQLFQLDPHYQKLLHLMAL
ncbi:glycosyltransferase [Paenibacillus mesotrionivorans]|uniref:Glycosyltransferase n=1 Tax=Paenibacillus mesotrionivorans TaxID=3160968 RepID=A0ACC7P0Z3_9BACL